MDGDKYGTQKISAGQKLNIDKGSPKKNEGSTDFLPEGDAGMSQEELSAAANPDWDAVSEKTEPGKSPAEENRPDLTLEPAESVAEQKARLDKEQAEQQKKSEKENLARAASAPLVGSVGDIGQMDMAGGGDLFSQKPTSTKSTKAEPEQVKAPAPVEKASGLTESESARLAELTDKVESGAKMTAAERKKYKELLEKSRPKEDERPEVTAGDEEPVADLGIGLKPGLGMKSEQEVRNAVKDVDTAGVPVNVITKAEAVKVTGRLQAQGYGGVS